MKVVEINSGIHGSTGTIMLSIANLVRADGEEAYTFSAPKSENAPTGHAFFGSKVENMIHRGMSVLSGISGKGSAIGTRSLLRKIDAIQPDILHLHNMHGWYIDLPMLFEYIKKNTIRTVWTLHDCWGFTAQCSHFTMEKCEKWKTGCHDCPRYRIYPYTWVDRTRKMWQLKKDWFSGVKNMVIVTPSEWLANLVRQSFLREYEVKVIHNGIDLSIFKPTYGNFRKKYGLEGKKIVLGVASGWSERKGLDVLVQLSETLPEEYKVVIVGTTEEVDRKLPPNILSIHRTHNQKELAELYTAADVFANPTREETFGLVNVEAIACGTPVVTFNVGGTSETVNENTGIVVDCDDFEAMKNAITELTSKEIQFCHCKNHAEKFSVENKFQEYIELYKKLLN